MEADHNTSRLIEVRLVERGLKIEEIRRGMGLLVGENWNHISTSDLIDKLICKGFMIPSEKSSFADELEALIRGALKLDDMFER